MFDLAAYLARIALKEAPSLSVDGLRQLQRAHRLAIPFENFDLLFGRGISLDPAIRFDKLVTRKRGGYCFEQNPLLLDAMRALGFEARLLLGRVWLGATELPPRTHTLLLVNISGEQWIADAGFGGSDCPPMKLAPHEVESPDGTRHRLSHDPALGWVLDRRGPATATDGRGGGDGWVRQYSFTTDAVTDTEVAEANHYVATLPGGRFTSNVVASLVLPTGFASLFNRSYRRSSAKGGVEEKVISSSKMLQIRLSLMFGIDLRDDEVATLWNRTA